MKVRMSIQMSASQAPCSQWPGVTVPKEANVSLEEKEEEEEEVLS